MRKFYLIPMALGALTLASCSDTIYDEPVQEEYSKDFINQFGTIDPNQDWNVAEVKSVTVNPGSASEVKIYAKNGAAYKLVGHYKDVSGEQTLKFDAMKTCDEFVVVAGGKGQVVNNGGSVNFTSVATRSYIADEVEGVFVKDEGYTEFTWDEVKSFASRLPEKENNSSPDNTGVSNVTNFKVISQASRTIKVYPVFWNADNNHTLGVYWDADRNGTIEEDERHEIYSDKEGDDVQVYVKRTENTYRNPDTYEGYENVTWNQFEEPSDVTKRTGFWPYNDETTYTGEIDKTKPILSRGFTVTIPDGVMYGFYIESYENGRLKGIFYSAADDNENGKPQSVFLRTKVDDGSTEGGFRTFLGFEDLTYTSENNPDAEEPDLNDFMLILDPSPLVVNEDAESWTIACEDLGATGDYDFNDIVFSVNHVAGSNKVTVTPLAAGGTLPTYITWNGTRINEGKELHEWIGTDGATAPSGFQYPMLNTEKSGEKGNACEVNVGTDFFIGITPDAGNMGGFSVEVVAEDGTIREVESPGRGEAPQMICVTGDWKWPYEKMNINEAYPEFGQWGQNYQTSEWYNYPNKEKVLGNSN